MFKFLLLKQVFYISLYWHTKPVHLISPHFNLPDTHIKHFSHSTSGNTLLPVTYVWHLHAGSCGTTPIHLQFSICRRPGRTPLQHSSPVSHTFITGFVRLVLQEFIVHIALVSLYVYISGSSTSNYLGYLRNARMC